MPIPSTPTHVHISASTHTHPLIHRACCQMILLKESPSLHSHSHHPKWGTHHFSPTVLQCHANLCSCQNFSLQSILFHITTEFIFLQRVLWYHLFAKPLVLLIAIKLIFLERNWSYYLSIQKMAVSPSCPVNWIQIAKEFGIQCPLQYKPLIYCSGLNFH